VCDKLRRLTSFCFRSKCRRNGNVAECARQRLWKRKNLPASERNIFEFKQRRKYVMSAGAIHRLNMASDVSVFVVNDFVTLLVIVFLYELVTFNFGGRCCRST